MTLILAGLAVIVVFIGWAYYAFVKKDRQKAQAIKKRGLIILAILVSFLLLAVVLGHLLKM